MDDVVATSWDASGQWNAPLALAFGALAHWTPVTLVVLAIWEPGSKQAAVVFAILGVAVLTGIGMGIVHARNNALLAPRRRVDWAVAITALSFFALPIYWWKFMGSTH